MCRSTSSRVIRPPGPLPAIVAGSRPCSFTSRRTTGDSSTPAAFPVGYGLGGRSGRSGRRRCRLGSRRPPRPRAARPAAAPVPASLQALAPPRPERAPARVPARLGAGAAASAAGLLGGAASSAGAGAAAGAAPESPTTAMTVPTSTVSPSGTRISVSTPATGDGTSVSTLSVDTSNNGSSAATVSPTDLNHCVMVPSVTVSPSWGSVTSAMGRSSFVLFDRGRVSQPLKLRPVSDNTVSPNSSVRLGWGWMNSATSSTVASQFTAR